MTGVYEGYKVASATQAGAGTTSILPALAAGQHYEIAHITYDITVKGAGTYKFQSSAPVICIEGKTTELHGNAVPTGKFSTSGTETFDLVVGVAGTVTGHVTYKVVTEA